VRNALHHDSSPKYKQTNAELAIAICIRILLVSFKTRVWLHCLSKIKKFPHEAEIHFQSQQTLTAGQRDLRNTHHDINSVLNRRDALLSWQGVSETFPNCSKFSSRNSFCSPCRAQSVSNQHQRSGICGLRLSFCISQLSHSFRLSKKITLLGIVFLIQSLTCLCWKMWSLTCTDLSFIYEYSKPPDCPRRQHSLRRFELIGPFVVDWSDSTDLVKFAD
jgi:hypothetical protein